MRTAPVWTALLLGVLTTGCKDAIGPAPELKCEENGTVLVNGQPVPAAPGGYVTVGNQIIDIESCEPHRFVGFSRPALAFSARDARVVNGAVADADFRRMLEWGANTVRLELAQHFWVPSSRFYDPEYPALVERTVKRARAAGLDVILALQYSDRGMRDYAGDILRSRPQQQMPDVNHTVPFWTEVAARFKGDGGIIYELYSEPYPRDPQTSKPSWSLWLNGGTVAREDIYDEIRPAYEAVGMQQLYDVVRSTGAQNLVIIGGTHWGYYLDGVPSHRIRGENIAYAAHPWDWPDKQPSKWEKDFGFLADTDPVILSEFGTYDCGTAYIKSVLDYADQRNLSWMAWAWWAPGASDPKRQEGRDDAICSFPMLLTDWDGTPSNVGQVVRDRMQSYGGR